MNSAKSQIRSLPVVLTCASILCSTAFLIVGCSYSRTVEFLFEVRDAETGLPLSEASISLFLYPEYRNPDFTISTNENGTQSHAITTSDIHFDPWDRWAIEITQEGYQTERMEFTPRVSLKSKSGRAPVTNIVMCISLRKLSP